jgi:hypothetical protein
MIIAVYQFHLAARSAKVCAAEFVLSGDERVRFDRMVSAWRERSIMMRASLRFGLA